MPRRLKTYVTSIGFFELAIAAPSMKAALEAWGSKSNLFHQGFAKETQDPTITVATMATPGVVLRRAVGSNDTFSRNAALPKDFAIAPLKQTTKKETPAAKEPQARKLGDKATVAAARAFERERRRLERKRVKEAATREKRCKQRELAIAKAETALEQAKRLHETKTQEIENARSALDRELQAEDARWQKQQASLEAVLVRARE